MSRSNLAKSRPELHRRKVEKSQDVMKDLFQRVLTSISFMYISQKGHTGEEIKFHIEYFKLLDMRIAERNILLSAKAIV